VNGIDGLQLWNLITDVSNPSHGENISGAPFSWRLGGKNNRHKDRLGLKQLQASRKFLPIQKKIKIIVTKSHKFVVFYNIPSLK
jgi:hypothetical protein